VDAEPPASYQRGECRTCEAMILWARMTKSGARNPLDYEPNPEKGNVILTGNGQAETLSKAEVERRIAGPTLIDPDVPDEPRYLSHFATCPQRGQHRRNGR
jgi:hypothetical protein